MKILVVSMLRLGDIIMSTPVFEGLRRKYGSEAEIHILINSQFKMLLPMLPKIDKVHLFDRYSIQQGLGEIERPIFESLDRLQSLIESLDRENFDQVINLTQNKLSARICGLVNAKDKMGMVIDENDQLTMGSNWFKYMNYERDTVSGYTFNYVDIFRYGANLGSEVIPISLNETQRGKDEARSWVNGKKPFVCVQILTSDPKKNWNYEGFIECLKKFKETCPSHSIFALGAPFESKEINEFTRLAQKDGLDVNPTICSLEAALSILKASKGLLTLDTSIKHLACAADIPIVEVCLGSSDYRKSGVYGHDGIIVAPKVSCYPCSHRGSCTKPSHLCSKSLDPWLVGKLFGFSVTKDRKSLKRVLQTTTSEVALLQTKVEEKGYWTAFTATDTRSQLAQCLELSSWKLFNRGEHKKGIGTFGSEAMEILSSLSVADVSEISDCEEIVRNCLEKTLGLGIQLQHSIKEGLSVIAFNSLQNEFAVLSGMLAPSDDQNSEVSFKRIRVLQNAIADFQNFNEIKLKIIRSLSSQAVSNHGKRTSRTQIEAST